MSMLETYRDYFDIDPDYFPAVNEAVINRNPDLWKKFYPHETFVKLIKDTVNVLTKKQNLSIWVAGAYGTGKSYAVLTLKKLLDASEAETREYFEKFNMDKDLCNVLQGVKNSGKILTVHRYGSSSIRGDHNLVIAIQESIENALKENGIENKGSGALKGAIIKWLLDSANKSYFNALVTGDHASTFGGDDADAILQKLNDFSGEPLVLLMDKIFKLADERQIKALSMNTKELSNWIKEIIKANNLKAIVFIWDEFSEYFENNLRSLTGFQEIAEISQSDPFYLMIVTHKSEQVFSDSDKDKNKILDRFVKPTCQIELPENMAFQLMGAAMVKNKDEAVVSDWNMTVGDLYDRTSETRELVKKRARISDDELKNILPIHPYAALLLKNISSAFNSNQRSMFDFIKNDRGDEVKGFQWFIDNYGPDDDNPLLTVDMLWDFFYETGKEQLAGEIRAILDNYARANTGTLREEECRVLKTILLLQAISQKVGDSVELFVPNEKNINNAFEGTDIDYGAANRCAVKLVKDSVLYEKPLGGGKKQYSAMVSTGDFAAIEKYKLEVNKKTTSALIAEGNINEALSLTGALKLRYSLTFAAVNDFDLVMRSIRNNAEKYLNRIPVVVTIAKDSNESVAISKKIKDELLDTKSNIVFVDATSNYLNTEDYDQYCDNTAQAMYYQGKDGTMAKQYTVNAKEILKKWQFKISKGEYIIYSKEQISGERVSSNAMLNEVLVGINRKRYRYSLEGTYNVVDNLYMANAVKAGVKCGCEQMLKGAYSSSNDATKLSTALKEVWLVEEKYWETKPYVLISKIKIHVDELIMAHFNESGRVSIATIYDSLKVAPFGFLPCNLTAFIIGFVLKEYIDGSYSCSDGITSTQLDIDKLQEMVHEIINIQNSPNPRYKDKYIVVMTEDEKRFNEATSVAFGISLNLCTSIEQTRERIREKMKEFVFPIWTLKYIIAEENLLTNSDVLKGLIDCYCGIANNNNIGTGSATDSDIAHAIGDLCSKNEQAAEDLKQLLSRDKCYAAMGAYLGEFENGILVQLASRIGDNGQYMNALRNKFNVDAATWVWNQETANDKIKEVILDYNIILESNKYMDKVIDYNSMLRGWIEKCQYIRISYEAMKNSLNDISDIVNMLYSIKRTNSLADSQKAKFYDLLCSYGEEFRLFYTSQVNMFKTVCEHHLVDLSDEEIQELFAGIGAGAFTKDKSEYMNMVSKKIEEYKINSKSTKLRAIWNEKSGTVSPKEWSARYSMPVACMVDDENMRTAKDAFNTVNRNHPDENSTDKAIAYFETTDLFEKLNDEGARNKAFVDNVIKRYSVILIDIEEVKAYLLKHTTSHPYDWLGMPEVEKRLEQMSKAKYDLVGCDKALEKIDHMDIVDVKKYLKDLIKDNMAVGMAIINEN